MARPSKPKENENPESLELQQMLEEVREIKKGLESVKRELETLKRQSGKDALSSRWSSY